MDKGLTVPKWVKYPKCPICMPKPKSKKPAALGSVVRVHSQQNVDFHPKI